MSWNEHASKMRMQESSSFAFKAFASETSASKSSSAVCMMVLVASSVALTMASSSWPALGDFLALNLAPLQLGDLGAGFGNVVGKQLKLLVHRNVDGAEIPLHGRDQHLGHTGHVGDADVFVDVFTQHVDKTSDAGVQRVGVNHAHRRALRYS